MTRLLVLRPQPGADATARRAAALGFETVVTPLFTVTPIEWDAPDPTSFDALLVTSANAIRQGGPQLAAYRELPLHAVGPMTAGAARSAGFETVIAGDRDGAAALADAVAQGHRRLLHIVGREHIALDHPEAVIDRRIVYAADAVERLPDAARLALAADAIVLLHSPRAARLFRSLAEAEGLTTQTIRVTVMSPSVAAAAGEGWRGREIADRPQDESLLAAAARLCDQG